MTTVRMNFEGNLGYTPDQIDQKVTLADILAQVQDAIVEWGEDTEVVLYQTNNGRGANYGNVSEYQMFDTAKSDDDDEN